MISASEMAVSRSVRVDTQRFHLHWQELAGPQTRTSMSIARIAKMFERATRLWAISPMMLTRNPANALCADGS